MGLARQRQYPSDQEFLPPLHVAGDEEPSAAPRLLTKSVIHTRCGSAIERRTGLGQAARSARSRGRKRP